MSDNFETVSLSCYLAPHKDCPGYFYNLYGERVECGCACHKTEDNEDE